MLVDDELLAWEDERWVAADDLAELPVPQTINTLLAARLEGLPDDERALLTQASVEGTLFHRGALRELAPELSEASLERSLATLVRRDVIRPDRASFAGDEAFRFRHLLIRDAAYRSLSKTTRADLHERFAAWLERTAGRAGPRVRGDRRLPPRAGVPLRITLESIDARQRFARDGRRQAARVGRAQGPRAQRSSGGDRTAREGLRAARPSTSRGAPRCSRSSARR